MRLFPVSLSRVRKFAFGCLIFFCSGKPALAQVPTATPSPENSPKLTGSHEIVKQTSLVSILNSIAKLEAELKARQEDLRSPQGQGRQEEITQQIQNTAIKLDQLRDNFAEIASGVDPEIFSPKTESTNVDWSRDLRDILSPLINEVRRLTSRPREMDRLRSTVEDFDSQVALINQAKTSLQFQRMHATDAKLLAELKVLEDDFDSRKQSIQTQLGIAKQKLDRRTAEQRSIGESVQNIFQLFFKSRGLNLVFAMLSAVLFWLAARRLHLLTGRFFKKETAERGFYKRLISVVLMLATVFGAVIVFLLALYFVGDWVLLILALMLILGVVWTSKQAVHQFWNHATLLLNMGSCREGERVVYGGIPWELESLSLYCSLVNPALVGGSIQLPIRDLSTLRSRAYQNDEAWFPTNPGDLVRFPDNSVGRVEIQSIEMVKIQLLGGSELLIPTTKFLESPPMNLSRGFRHFVLIGLDYQHQTDILVEIPLKMKQEVIEGLKRDGYFEKAIKIEVDFEEAASSSLTLKIEVDFHGTLAHAYDDTKRTLSACGVAACNKYGWTIPFNQLTVHLPDSKVPA